MFYGYGMALSIGKKQKVLDIAKAKHVLALRPVNETAIGMAEYDKTVILAYLLNYLLYRFVTYLSENLPRHKVFKPTPVVLPKENDFIISKGG